MLLTAEGAVLVLAGLQQRLVPAIDDSEAVVARAAARLHAIKRMREPEREGPGEVVTLATEILAADGPAAVARAEACHGDPPGQEYRDLRVPRFAGDGRCTRFEEWPYRPQRPHSAPDDLA